MSTLDFSLKTNFSEHVNSNVEKSKTSIENLVNVYELEKCENWIRKNNLQSVCLQFPDSLLPDSVNISLYLKENLEQNVYILGDTSYGSCCVDTVAAKHINADGIIHFGNACLSSTEFEQVLYVFNRKKLDIEEFAAEFNKSFDVNDKVLIIYEVGYAHLATALQDSLKDYKNIQVSTLVIPGSVSENELHNQILFGRQFNLEHDETGSALFIGKDCMLLHNFILYLNGLKWYLYDCDKIESKLIEYSFNSSKFLRQRMHLIERIKHCNVVGILVGTLSVSNYLGCVDRLKSLCKKHKKKSYILAVGKPNVTKLANFPEIDVFVLISCPENNLSREFKEYYKPIVTLFEMETALGDRTWDSKYMSDFSQLLPGGIAYQKTDTNPPEAGNSDDTEQVSDALLQRSEYALTKHGGSEFLTNRSWRGLEQNLGESPVEKAVPGRTGIALGYKNDQNNKLT